MHFLIQNLMNIPVIFAFNVCFTDCKAYTNTCKDVVIIYTANQLVNQSFPSFPYMHTRLLYL